MNDVVAFRSNSQPTMGVELELMLIDPACFDLKPSAIDLVSDAGVAGLAERVKLEITDSMIEINSSIHIRHEGLLAELQQLRKSLTSIASAHATSICGGGTHPFHRWQERRVSPTERFQKLGHLYGYLAKQFTVFGQHIHIGCRDGDAAVRTIQRLSLYIPHFIALAAASPFHRGVDTGFDSCRLNMIAAFPLSGRMPPVQSWDEFLEFYARLKRLQIVGSIKDLYWDIRPKPEFGTVELRIADTPLDVTTAAALAAYAQILVQWSDDSDVPLWLDDFIYRHNRFQAARFGFDRQIRTKQRFRLPEHFRRGQRI